MLVHERNYDSRVNIAATRTHKHACQRSKAHRRINTFTVLDSRQGRTVAQVAVDNAQIFFFLTHYFSNSIGYIAMARTVEAVTTNSVVFIVFIRQAVHISFCGTFGIIASQALIPTMLGGL